MLKGSGSWLRKFFKEFGESIMSVSASIDITLAKKLPSSIKLISSLIAKGWRITNRGRVHFLPLGDKDDYDWKEQEIPEAQLYDMIRQKESCKEKVGISIYWMNTDTGMDVLFLSERSIAFSLTINRRVLFDRITDVNWYLERILPGLMGVDIVLEGFEFVQWF